MEKNLIIANWVGQIIWHLRVIGKREKERKVVSRTRQGFGELKILVKGNYH